MKDLTVCITSFGREEHLARALCGCAAAEIENVAVAAVCPTDGIRKVLAFWAKEFDSFRVGEVRDDIGCNATWALAAYCSTTRRIIVLHDDDMLKSEFGEAYRTVIAPALDSGRFVTWEAEHVREDGQTSPCRYMDSVGKEGRSDELWNRVVGNPTRFSLSPCVSVMDAGIVIGAAKEAEQCLTRNASLQRPGMILGTEILAYARHIGRYPRWLYVDRILSQYGLHEGSGTVGAEKTRKKSEELVRGYNLARAQAALPPPQPKPRVILVHSVPDKPLNEREKVAQASWEYLFSTGHVIDLPVRDSELPRMGPDGFPYVRDLIDAGCQMAQPEDIIAYVNSDIGLVTNAYEKIVTGVERGRGCTGCARRLLVPKPGRLYHTVTNCKMDGGFDLFAMTPAWWLKHREAMPDMLIGREAWDLVLRTLFEETADPVPISREVVCCNQEMIELSRAYTDDVCYHHPHASKWRLERWEAQSQVYNQTLALRFFGERNYWGIVKPLLCPGSGIKEILGEECAR